MVTTTHAEKDWEREGGREGEKKNLCNEVNHWLEDVFLEKEKVYGNILHCSFHF